MAGRLDRYVAAAVFGAYGAALLFLVGMFMVFDLLFQMPRYLEGAAKSGMGTFGLLWGLTELQVYRLPYVFVTIAPFVTVIAAMFALSRLMAANEVAPMLFTGRSMFRVLRPMLGVAVMSALLMGAVWQWVIPAVAEQKESLEASLTGQEVNLDRITLRSKDNPRLELFCRAYRHGERAMRGVILFDRGSARGDGIYVEAAGANWNPELRDWELVDGVRKTGEAPNQTTTRQELLGMEGLTPDLVVDSAKARRETSGLSYTELRALMRLVPGKPDYILAYHVHFTFPLANLVLLLLALPFAVNFERGRRIERVVFAIAVCAVYLVVDLTCRNLVYNVAIMFHPVIAAWTPTIVFGSLGAVVFGGTRT
ncbi:MAG: LptF/LptG family permease [Planctomycetes bacterium]|nr:LptF/LptG family permease [Planctomycetota bacterium]MCB9870392.1 LptF/LptG family permease [Planctomycetota bacterium]MCB9889383.1 LptF/LptG family permease [Planctomycetota bacterium]